MLRYWFSVQSESFPPGALTDSQSESLPPGALADSQSESLPPGVPADSQSESLPPGVPADSQSESLPPGVPPDSQSVSLPPGVPPDSQSVSLPPGVPADLQSAVKKCSTTFPPPGFAIPILFICISFSRQALRLILNQKVSRQAFRRICNPLSKNVRPLPPGDLQSPSSLFVFHSKTIARMTIILFSCVIVFF